MATSIWFKTAVVWSLAWIIVLLGMFAFDAPTFVEVAIAIPAAMTALTWIAFAAYEKHQ